MKNYKNYKLRLTFDVSVAPWRIDDQSIRENVNWALSVYDINNNGWVYIAECDRPGENHTLTRLEILDNELDEASGSTPEVPTDGVNS